MSLIQQLLNDRADWLEYLTTTYNIIATYDESFNKRLVSLKYHQFDSPRNVPIVNECRGIVIDSLSRKVIARGYDRFFNIEEPLAATIDWNTTRVQEKLDGSLCLLSYDAYWYHWIVSTSGSPEAGGRFGAREGDTFRSAFWELFESLKMTRPSTTPEYLESTFMFELCDAPNRVVVKHDSPRLVLHGARHTSTGREYTRDELINVAVFNNWELVKEFPIATAEQCLAAAIELDPIQQEGFVVVDANFNRVKVKSPRYVVLHHMRDEVTPRRAIELWKTGEASELLSYFPEMAQQILPIHEKLDKLAQCALDSFVLNAGVQIRKDFAEAIKGEPWAAICFKMYGNTVAPSLERAKELMRAHPLSALEHMLETY